LDTYDAWLADFRRRLAQHDMGVRALARDLADRTPWTVRAIGARGFPVPPATAGHPPDVLCERGSESRAICFEVELPETLVRRPTVARLRRLADQGAVEPRVVLVGAASSHERQISQARAMLSRAGLALSVVAIAPEEGTITGADW
jgi:hypothetical protein